MNYKEQKSIDKDAREVYVQSLLNQIKNLLCELEILKKDSKETKEANIKLVTGLVKMLNINNVEDIKNEISKIIKEAKDILLNDEE